MFCRSCGAQVADGNGFCSNCGHSLEASASEPQMSGEQVLGCVLFGGYYMDIGFTDRRVIQFEPLKKRWKFLTQALGPKRLVVDRTSTLEDVLLFIKAEIPRAEISRIEVKAHGRFARGRIRVVKRSGESVDLARLDVDIEKESYAELMTFIGSIYQEIPKAIS
jgi:zinc ribbon protein